MDPVGGITVEFCAVEKMKPWVEQYTPKILSEVIGQDAALSQLKRVVMEKGVGLLHGPSGVGKTCSVYALAHDLGYEVLELNASDFRDEASITSIAGGSLQQASLFNRGKIVLVDELEGISGAEDRGGLSALNALLDTRGHAVVLVANDPWDKKFSTVRKKCMLIEYKPVHVESVARLLKRVCEQEGVQFLEEDLKSLGRRSGGDVRAALNDLQVICAGKKEVRKEDFSILGEREQEKSVFTALQVILKGKDGDKALDVLDALDMDLPEVMLWLEENIGREYKGQDLEKGYDMLGKADVFQGRIHRWQYWRFLVYVRFLMSAGVSLVKEHQYYGYTPYSRYTRILKIWMANQKYKRRKDVALKIGRHTHVSSRYAARYLVPYVKMLYQKKQQINLPFSEEEVEWLEEH